MICISKAYPPISRRYLIRKSCIKKFCVSTRVPENKKAVAYWMIGMSALVAGMVTVGGITRLTRSGLSMTDWKLQGSLPPSNQEEWGKEFDRYKQFPEWQQRQSMTLEEFKFIYFWEYGHRMYGRFLGFAFVLPLGFFAWRRQIPRELYMRLGGLFCLGGTQGLIGWWMVKSGLNLDPSQKKEIRVSPYRLATHLGVAFTTYSALLWTGLDLLNTLSVAKEAASKIPHQLISSAKTLRRASTVTGAIVATTVISGAFVAGNDAGRAFNSWPLMGDHLIPPDILEMSPMWRNVFENTATVQFDHRLLAYSTLGSVAYLYTLARTLHGGALWRALPVYTRLAFNAAGAFVVAQVGLGISVLLLYVPVPLAVLHQAGSLALLTSVTCLVHSLRFSKFPGFIGSGIGGLRGVLSPAPLITTALHIPRFSSAAAVIKQQLGPQKRWICSGVSLASPSSNNSRAPCAAHVPCSRR